MYIICAGMIRSCSTWQYMVLSDLVERYKHGERSGFIDGAQYATVKARDLENERGVVDSCVNWRVVKVHEEDEEFAKDLLCGTARAVYSFRDLRDVTFSLMRLRMLSFDELVFDQGLLDIIIKSHYFWTFPAKHFSAAI